MWWWIKSKIWNIKYDLNQRKQYKIHMKMPKHRFDFRQKKRVLIAGCKQGKEITCCECGAVIWSSSALDCEDNVGEYGMRGCKGRDTK
jgi:hypothetical protein